MRNAVRIATSRCKLKKENNKTNLLNKMKKLISLIALALTFVACNEDPEVITVGREINIVAMNPTVRTQVGNEDDEKVALLWAPNETIGVFGDQTVNAQFTSSNTVAAEATTFVGSVAEEDNAFVAYYPFVEGATNMAALHFTLNSEQTQTADGPAIAENDLKYGVLEANGTNKYTCEFQQCFSLVKFTIDVTDSEVVKEMYLDNIWLQSDGAVLAGDFVLNVNDGTLTKGDAQSDGINLYFENRPALSEGVIEGWVVLNPELPAGSVLNFVLTAVDAAEPTDNESYITATAELTTLKELQVGTAYNIPIKTKFLTFPTFEVSTNEINFTAEGGSQTVTVTTDYSELYAEAADEWVTVDQNDNTFTITAAANTAATTRSTTVTISTESASATITVNQEAADVEVEVNDEPANCYMISAAGNYSFDATVMGNGASGVIAGAGFHTTDAVITGGASAELLWQDTAGFITSVSYDNGRITYTAGGNVGNAVIAVKNSAGTILWSWHIWGTGDRAVEDEVYTNQAGATFTVMDRNLGQLKMIYSTDLHTEGEPMYVKQDDGTLYSEKAAAIETINCTLYQWGRKDPVPSAATRYNINNEATDISTSYPVLNYNNFSSADEATIEYSIQNPAYLIDTYKYTSNPIWEKDGNAYLWGGGSSTTYVQYMDNTSAVAGWENEKTIYDPCPAGYRVANPYTWTGFVGGTASGGTGRDGAITLTNAPASTFVDYNKDGVFSDNEKLTPWDTTNDVAIVDGEEQLKQDLRAIVSYYQVDYTNTKWVIKSGDYLLSSTEDTEGAVECNYITRYYAPVYCQGLFFMSDENDKTGSFYPMISYRNGSNGSFNTAGLGYYWSSGPGGSTASAYYLKLGAYSYKSSGNSLSIDVFDNKGKRDAQPVRCVKY